MIGQIGRARDPFEGKGARRREIRLRIEGILAIALAIGACGLTAAVWIQVLAPMGRLFGLD